MDITDEMQVFPATLWLEARSEGFPGLIAVGHTVLTRKNDKRRWPNNIIGVCLQPNQYSCWNNRYPKDFELPQGKLWECVVYYAKGLIEGFYPDRTAGANHYHADYLDEYPSWAAPKYLTVHIRKHMFYRL